MHYHMIAIDIEMALEPGWMRRGLGVLGQRVFLGSAHALPLRSFDMVGEWEMAFRSLQAGQNTGKVVLRISTVRAGDVDIVTRAKRPQCVTTRDFQLPS